MPETTDVVLSEKMRVVVVAGNGMQRVRLLCKADLIIRLYVLHFFLLFLPVLSTVPMKGGYVCLSKAHSTQVTTYLGICF